MTITAIELENFKGFSDRVRIELKPITLLVGANSAGKSSVFHALMYLRNILVDDDPFGRVLGLSPEHDLGGFRNVVHKHDVTTPIVMRIEMDLGLGSGGTYENAHWPYVPGYADLQYHEGEDFELRKRLTRNIEDQIRTAWVEVSIVWDSEISSPRVVKYSAGINAEWIGVIERPDPKKPAYISQLNFMHPVFEPGGHDVWWNDMGKHYPPEDGNPRNEFEYELRAMTSEEQMWAGTDEVKLSVGARNGSAIPLSGASRIGFKGKFREEFFNMMVGMLLQALVGPLDLAIAELKDLRYLGPLRAIPPRDFGHEVFEKESDWANGLAGWTELIKDYEGGGMDHEVVGEYLVNYDIRVRRIRELDRDSVGHILDSDVPITSEQLRELWAAIDEKSPFRWKIELVDKRSGTAIEPRDVGVGISQLLPVIVAARKSGFLCVEQPELHLHPKMQVELGQIFLEGWWGNEGSTQFLIETHSEHLILRLLRRIREGQLKPEDVNVLYVDARVGGKTTATSMKIGGDGDFLEQWPEGFFAERAEELF